MKDSVYLGHTTFPPSHIRSRHTFSPDPVFQIAGLEGCPVPTATPYPPPTLWHGHMFPVEHLLEELFLKVLILWPYGLVRTCAFQKAAKSHDDTVWVQPHPRGLLRHAHQPDTAFPAPRTGVSS